MIYLACPYSHSDPAVCEARFHAACRATAELLIAGKVVFAPVVYGHPLVAHGVPGDWSVWSGLDRAMIERCEEVLVLALPGWDTSVGIRQEVLFARSLGKPVIFVVPKSRPDPGVATASPTSAHGGHVAAIEGSGGCAR